MLYTMNRLAPDGRFNQLLKRCAELCGEPPLRVQPSATFEASQYRPEVCNNNTV